MNTTDTDPSTGAVPTSLTPAVPASEPGHLDVIPLGGMGEIGKNIFAYRYGDEIMVVDGGLAFPDSHQMGIDLIIPRIDYLQQNAHMIKRLDSDARPRRPHRRPALHPAPPAPRARVRRRPDDGPSAREAVRIRDQGADTDLREVGMNDKVQIGTHFHVEFIRMTHSIPDNAGYILTTPVGRVLHTGDFKLDEHPTDGLLSDLRAHRAGGQGRRAAADQRFHQRRASGPHHLARPTCPAPSKT